MNNEPRAALQDSLNELIDLSREAQKQFALLLININHFRQFNISNGYRTGDQLLVAFQQRLQDLSREQDQITRVGNADFVMLLPEILNQGHTTLAAIKIINSLHEPFELEDSSVKVSASIGIAIFPDHADDAQTLMLKAETALTEAYTDLQSYTIYSPAARSVQVTRWDIESELQQAIDRSDFELYFQPQVHLQSGKLYGAEALIRWQNGDQGFVRPDIFIPIAEQSGQIYEITKWTINAAIWLMKDWPCLHEPLKVSVNLSTKMLAESGLVETIENALNIHRIANDRLTLEITESALVEDYSTSFQALDELSSLGINISIDDFGTGYSSMAYFKNIPANELKIDRSFVSYMLENQMDLHIVKTVIKMAQGFNLEVVAEGIEDAQSCQALKDLGCDIAQGYHIARPMPQQAFIDWINKYHGAGAKQIAR